MSETSWWRNPGNESFRGRNDQDGTGGEMSRGDTSINLLKAMSPLPIKSTRSTPIKRSGTALASGRAGWHRSGFLHDYFWLSKSRVAIE